MKFWFGIFFVVVLMLSGCERDPAQAVRIPSTPTGAPGKSASGAGKSSEAPVAAPNGDKDSPMAGVPSNAARDSGSASSTENVAPVAQQETAPTAPHAASTTASPTKPDAPVRAGDPPRRRT